MTARIVVIEVAELEAAHLADLVEQFSALLRETPEKEIADDPAVARLVPDAYRDDIEAARDFRGLTQGDLLARRVADAEVVLDSLRRNGERVVPSEIDEASALDAVTIQLDTDQVAAWLRTLTSVRLVLAARLGIAHESDHDPDDPRFGVYDWLGFRLEGLLQAIGD